MKVLMRADASVTIGSGHVMRCLTLAEELRERGVDVHFACREHPGNLADYVQQKGFTVHWLPMAPTGPAPEGGHAAWLGADWETDAEQVADILQAIGQVDWLIVDHYALDYRWEERLRPHAQRIFVIDDLADRRHSCHALLDQNFYQGLEDRYRDLIPSSCRALLGPAYALLRKSFVSRRGERPARRGKVRRILVYFGASDPTGETLKTLRALARLQEPGLEIETLIGVTNPLKAEIEALAPQIPGCRIHHFVEDMAQLLASVDLVVGAGGTTSWERCCLGLPSIVVSIAKNQEETSRDLAQAGYILYPGSHEQVTSDTLYHLLSALLASDGWRESLAERSAELVDGRGLERVLDLISPPEIRLRRAEAGDCEDLYGWRNAEETRRHFFNPEPIAYEDHRRWFLQTLENPDRVLLIGECDGDSIGVLRYDLDGDTAVVSVYLVPGKHRRGLGSHLLQAGSTWLFSQFDRIRSIRAEVLERNQASQGAFLKAGYRRELITFVDHRTDREP